MLTDVGITVANHEGLFLVVRSTLTLGVPDPAEVRVPVMAVSATPSFKLRRVTVRPMGGPDDRRLDFEPRRAPRAFKPASRDIQTAWSKLLGKYCAFRCVVARLDELDVSQPEARRLVVEAEIESHDGDVHRLSAPTSLEISPLPSPRGWHPGDPHVHTKVSDGKLDIKGTVRHARNASGLSWVVLTDHAHTIRKWSRYASLCEKAQQLPEVSGLLVGAGAEFAALRRQGEGHVLGYAMKAGGQAALPQPAGAPQAVISSIRAQNPPRSFAAIAHPYLWRYDWRDWGVAGFRAMELATGGCPSVRRKTATRWFRMLRKDLRGWSGANERVPFVVGLASTDSHEIPLSVMPGERHITWVNTGADTPLTENPRALYSALGAGHCVASCGGDFAALRMNGHGPGEVCPNDGRTPLVCEFEMQPRRGSRFEGARLLNRFGSTLREWDAVDGQSFTHHLDPPQQKSFYVAQFDFSDGAGQRWEVWTNPVWVRKP